MITVAEWENGKAKLSNEIFEPFYEHPKTEIDHIIGNRLIAFIGTETGTVLEPAFMEVLEKC